MPGSHATLAPFAKFISRTMGLHFPKERFVELGQKLAPVAKEAGYPDLDQFLAWLKSAPLSRDQLETLARALTIGETYFLRDPRSYQVLEQELLPGLIAQRRGTGKQLRIWSAGCSSGEEPYTLAILLSRLLPDLASWDISITATDINPLALERGRQGIYSQWSFRNAPAWLMDYFTKGKDGRYQIIPRIRSMVRFDYLNLAEQLEFEARIGGTGLLDVIFCRNVLLYFAPAQIERTMGKFRAALCPGGWLFVGPTEVDQRLLEGFSCLRFPGAFVLSKAVVAPRYSVPSGASVPRPGLPVQAAPGPEQVPGTTAQPSFAADPAAAPGAPQAGPSQAGQAAEDDGNAEAIALYQAGCYQQAAESVRRALDLGPQPADALALGARAFANLGRFAEARELCEQAIAADRLSAQSHYLLSIIQEQQGDLAAAASSLKNVLFIDQENLLAYFALGNLSRQAGDAWESERHFANALRLLERRDPREVLPEAEGMTAGGLAQMIRVMTRGRSEHGEE
jgi:chemotaxis protein methyltransferase CheR